MSRPPPRQTAAQSASRRAPASPTEGGGHRWTFLSNHAHVLMLLAKEPDVRIRDLASRIGITERAVSTILRDLEEEGLITRQREGRRNTYVLTLDKPLRHPVERHRSVQDLIDLLLG